MITRNKLYLNVKNLLDTVGIEPASFEAACLLESIYGIPCDKIKLDDATECTDDELDRLQAMLERRIVGYPLQYLVGSWEFYGLPFKVGEGVLIPRADTETLVDFVVERFRGRRPVTADLCTGSGCIAVAIADKLSIPVYAVELSDDAIGYAHDNIAINGADVTLIRGDVLSEDTALLLPPLDLLVCNPPYLTLEDMSALQDEVSYEPSLALYGGEDGLDFYRRISALWRDRLNIGGMIVFEIGTGQEDACRAILKENGYSDIGTRPDLSGITRIIHATRQED